MLLSSDLKESNAIEIKHHPYLAQTMAAAAQRTIRTFMTAEAETHSLFSIFQYEAGKTRHACTDIFFLQAQATGIVTDPSDMHLSSPGHFYIEIT